MAGERLPATEFLFLVDLWCDGRDFDLFWGRGVEEDVCLRRLFVAAFYFIFISYSSL